ncbi:MAG: sigma-54-dependent Fis family transcriptional regulator [Desulfurivibrio sp.]|nr:sigma-54-dependent Fis family transcriptional regulator [Desulfurivibrio sp.]
MGKKSPPPYPLSPVLLVDDELHTLASFDIALRSHGITNTIRCQDSREVASILDNQPVEIILLDLMMPHVSGQDILTDVSRRFPELPVIIVTGVNEVETAVHCIQQGAFDYVLKPVEIERLLPSIKRALEIRQLRRENSRLASSFFEKNLARPEVFSKIITGNETMKALFRYCEAIAEGRQPVLITGETGSGKESIARAIHDLSGRQGEYVAVNVAGLDDQIFADTLFGHAKGAFTGADRSRSGLVEKAAGGSLFLDEIGDLSEALQVKLLRFLEEREYYALGSDQVHHSDARVIVATHHDLEQQHKKGLFRTDLFYRLRTHRIQVPPLRERKDDLPALLDFFLTQAAAEFKKAKPRCPDALFPLLAAYDFPGNVRELRALAFDAVSHHRGATLSMAFFHKEIGTADPQDNSSDFFAQNLPHKPWAAGLDKLPTLKDANQELIAEALKRSNNNQRAAALILGITPQALNQRLKRQV